ncbi:hypothetical protein [Dysgonomonas mossii]|uniref:hypothetical protein n=1 Tax=Dysgonomonas mossii TaxID=163665 RepID=UPI003996AD8E
MAKKTSKRKSKFTRDGFERISIWQTNIGDLVCYLTAQKIYLIADKTEEYVMLVSATQQYKTYSSFDVKRVLRAEDVNEPNYNALLEKFSDSDKNVSLNDLRLIGEEYKQTGSVSSTTLEAVIPIITNKPNNTPNLEAKEGISFAYKLPDNWNADNWFDSIQDKKYRTEKEVETKFILPLLARLGYTEDDRYDAMPTFIPHGSKKISMEIDFAMFAADSEELKDISILLVEAKKEERLTKQTELMNAQLQLKSYAIGTGCKFGLITDSKTVQVLDLMPNMGAYKVIFECQRAELKSSFIELYNHISRERLKDYYLELI